jgi:integrase
MPRWSEERATNFTDEEVGKILAAAPEPFSTILALTAILGLRIGEILVLRVGDVDFTPKIVRARQSLDAVTRNVQAVKSQASSADVPMPLQLASRLPN